MSSVKRVTVERSRKNLFPVVQRGNPGILGVIFVEMHTIQFPNFVE